LGDTSRRPGADSSLITSDDRISRLESSEDLFRALTAHTSVGVFVSNAAGGCEYVNERWCELTGLTPEEASGDGWTAALHPDDATRVTAEWEQASAAGRDSTVEYRFLRADGGVSWIQGFASALRNDQGDIVGWVGTCLDLTAQRTAADELRNASERFRTAFDNAPIGMSLVAPDGTWLEVNPALCKLLGYSADELMQLDFLQVTHPDDRPESAERRRRQLKGAHEPSIEKRYVGADGEIVWVSVTSTLVRDASGLPLYSVAQIEDIGNRKRADAELRRLADHDSLTGLFNRRRFGEELDRELQRRRRHGGSAALLVLDLDRFKYVNDSLGHKAGDDLLIAVAETLRSRCRRTDCVGRLGGDEFAVLAVGIDVDGARLLADDIAAALRSQRFAILGSAVAVTASVGVVVLDGDGADGDSVLVAADRAMYRAKRDGRDRVALVA
jgi:diguanylate cyclase (GGDEF)-like protein/PAS domain S-box-containing protein